MLRTALVVLLVLVVVWCSPASTFAGGCYGKKGVVPGGAGGGGNDSAVEPGARAFPANGTGGTPAGSRAVNAAVAALLMRLAEAAIGGTHSPPPAGDANISQRLDDLANSFSGVEDGLVRNVKSTNELAQTVLALTERVEAVETKLKEQTEVQDARWNRIEALLTEIAKKPADKADNKPPANP